MALLERDGLLAGLRDGLSAAQAEGGRFVWIAGEAGAGKSTVVDAFVRSCPADVEIRLGVSDPLTTARPLGPLRDMLSRHSPIASALARAAPHDAFSLLLDELRSATDPVVLVFEDAHWADEATCDLLRYLARRITSVHALVLVTYRDDEVGVRHPLRLVLGDVAGAHGVQRLQVPRLSRDAVTALAMSQGVDGSRLFALTAGNAFYVSEVLATVAVDIPPTVTDAVLARAARLSARARLAVDAASVIPVAAEPWLLQQVTGAEPADLDECVTSGLLVPDAEALRFRHEIARLAIDGALQPAMRRHLHRQILELLVAQPTSTVDAARLAHHAVASDDAAAVLTHVLPAAEAATALGAHREAASHLTAVLSHGHLLPRRERATLLDKHGYECYLTGQISEAVTSRLAASDLWRQEGDDVRVGDELRWLARLHWLLGHTAEANDFGRQAVEVLEPEPPGYELAMAYSNMAQLAMLSDRNEPCVEWVDKAMTVAEKYGFTDVVVHALNTLGAATYDALDGQGRRHLERSLELSLEHGMEEHAARAYTNLLSLAVKTRDVEQARTMAEDGIDYSECRDLDNWTIYMTSWRALLGLATDDWTRAREDALRVIRRPDVPAVSAVTALAVLARLRARFGDPDAWSAAQQALELAMTMQEPQRLQVAFVACCEVTWLTGTPVTDLTDERFLDAARRAGPWERTEFAIWSKRLGIPVDVASDPAAIYTLKLEGRHEEAVEAWLARGFRYEAALAALDSGQPALMRRAVEWLTQLGASAARDQAVRQLQEIGLRGPRAATAATPGGLTRREVDVLGLVAEGFSNAEIADQLVVSKRTIDHHVSAILRKLDVSKRSHAARKARELEILPVK